MSARGGPAHLLAFDHPFRNQGIDRGFRQAGRNAAPRSISRTIIDKRGPIGADVCQKLLTKAVVPGGRQIALASQLVHRVRAGACFNRSAGS